MALEEIKLWAMDGAGDTTSLETADQTKSERLLEGTLVKNPEMLMPGLTLVGRQTPTDGGPLDLLGIDEDGRLVVFELKRGTLTRDAVAQVIDYASFLQDKPDDDLARYISDRSSAHGTTGIEDFDEWYDTKSGGQGFSALKPVRMVLVGLGVDERTTRMVRFLAKGVDIALLTFHGFNYNGSTFLARHVQVEGDSEPSPNGRRATPRVPQRVLVAEVENRVKQYGEEWEEGYLIWTAVRQMFREAFANFRERASRSASDWAPYRINSSLRRPRGRMQAAAVQFTPQELRPRGQCVEIVFFPSAVQLRLEEFTQLRKEIPYITYPLNDPEKETGVLEIKFIMKSTSDWDTYKDKLTAIAKSVFEANEANLEGEEE